MSLFVHDAIPASYLMHVHCKNERMKGMCLFLYNSNCLCINDSAFVASYSKLIKKKPIYIYMKKQKKKNLKIMITIQDFPYN
jgi:hypothetical protein